MNIRHDRERNIVVVEQPGHAVGWAFAAAAALVVPAGIWAAGIAASGGVAIVIGASALAAAFLAFAAMALTAVTATFDGGARTLTVRRDRPWGGAVRQISFADIRGVAASKVRWLDADEYRFEIALADGRSVKLRYRRDDETLVQRAAGEIDQFVRR